LLEMTITPRLLRSYASGFKLLTRAGLQLMFPPPTTRLCFLALALLGCQLDVSPQPKLDAQIVYPDRDAEIDAQEGGASDVVQIDVVRIDTDGDGLCDDTEARAGTDPERSDSDGDGIADANERGNGFDPLDPDSPGIDRLAFLRETVGASVQILAEVWVEGQGESFTGEIESVGAVAAHGLTAADLGPFVEAVSADPADHAFDLQPKAGRFGAVHGETRLTFLIGFTFTDQQPAGCTRGLPFTFSVKRTDSDAQLGRRRYLLVLHSQEEDAGERQWCTPSKCF